MSSIHQTIHSFTLRCNVPFGLWNFHQFFFVIYRLTSTFILFLLLFFSVPKDCFVFQPDFWFFCNLSIFRTKTKIFWLPNRTFRGNIIPAGKRSIDTRTHENRLHTWKTPSLATLGNTRKRTLNGSDILKGQRETERWQAKRLLLRSKKNISKIIRCCREFYFSIWKIIFFIFFTSKHFLFATYFQFSWNFELNKNWFFF